MNAKVFIDTNILVYAYNSDDDDKQNIAAKLLNENLAEEEIYISVQVLNEFYAVLSRHKITHLDIKQYADEIISSVRILPISVLTTRKAFTVKEKYHYSWWDSLVLASALENDCKIIYSEDMQHGQVIENTLEIVNPFV
ncbi:MAG: PIN domain-containing protein [Fibromonadaceae bacterium]|jgi:predicted nucleic acid-binding protein|nr:PIN domain-containing protein [Fibromonadaceae bacterium]